MRTLKLYFCDEEASTLQRQPPSASTQCPLLGAKKAKMLEKDPVSGMNSGEGAGFELDKQASQHHET